MRGSNLFMTMMSTVTHAGALMSSFFTILLILNRLCFRFLLTTNWSTGLFIANLVLFSLACTTGSIVYWFGSSVDQSELFTALQKIGGFYLSSLSVLNRQTRAAVEKRTQ